MATARAPDPKTISEVAHQEGGTTKDSESAKLQSQLTKDRNAEQVDAKVADKLEHGEVPTKEEANLARSREARAPDATPTNGSVSAQAQSAAERHANFEATAKSIVDKMQHDPSHISKEEASHLESVESHDKGGIRPPNDSISAEAKRMASANEAGRDPVASATKTADPAEVAKANTHTNGTTDDSTSHLAMMNDLKAAIDVIKPKMDHEPNAITQEDASLLESAEHAAKGYVEKGGLASKAQHLATENQKVAAQVT